MTTISIRESAGSFAENMDVARELRVSRILPALERGEDVVLDFAGVDAATQSFVHVLISEVIRRYGPEALDRLSFKSCSETVQKIIAIVAESMQEGD